MAQVGSKTGRAGKPVGKRVIDHHFPPPDEELSMIEAAIEKMLSFDTFMAVAVGHLIKRGYQPAREWRGRISRRGPRECP